MFLFLSLTITMLGIIILKHKQCKGKMLSQTNHLLIMMGILDKPNILYKQQKEEESPEEESPEEESSDEEESMQRELSAERLMINEAILMRNRNMEHNFDTQLDDYFIVSS